MKRPLVLFMLFVMVFIPSVSAQDAPLEDFKCDLPSLQNAIDIFIGALGQLKVGKETDTAKISNELQKLANGANIRRAACDGLAFSGVGTKLIGPFQIPAGLYRAIMTTDDTGYVGADITVTEGTCGVGSGSYLSTLLFNSAGGEAKNGIESLFSSSGCALLVQLKIGASNWNMKFERLTTD